MPKYISADTFKWYLEDTDGKAEVIKKLENYPEADVIEINRLKYLLEQRYDDDFVKSIMDYIVTER